MGVVARRPWLAFVLMGGFFALFGATSLNLIYIFRANIGLIVEHGWLALASGAAWQLLELVLYGYLSAAFFVGFKVCEKLLVESLAQHD
ncbi:MAG: hypothetical protein L6Q60_10370 [Rhodocyclaceae bacterium]|nr:hypothetical protein [Rhodocyclaceae bacterium]